MAIFVKINIIQCFLDKNRLNFGKYKGFGRLIKIQLFRFFTIKIFSIDTSVF
ncbi:hypothetical protein D3C86_716960 [compost metagenome]